MLIKNRKGWELPEAAATPEARFRERRRFAKLLAAGPVLAVSAPALLAGPARAAGTTAADLYPAPRNGAYTVDRPMTAESDATGYNNFYEFGSHKRIADAAQALKTEPWQVTIDGEVEKQMTVDAEDLIRRFGIEERVHRFRCVEAWAMTVPWSGFPLAKLVDFARPLSSARYLVMTTFEDPSVAPGQNQVWYPWPYIDGLTMAEAYNELAFMATGIYGKPLPPQNGAPIRLIAPWKYGFKGVKSIVRLTFSRERPVSFWEHIQPSEYGFWANVNPEVPHPRWSQATERLLTSGDRVPTQLFNGYGDYVAGLYKGLEGEKLYM